MLLIEFLSYFVGGGMSDQYPFPTILLSDYMKSEIPFIQAINTLIWYESNETSNPLNLGRLENKNRQIKYEAIPCIHSMAVPAEVC